MSLGTEWEPGAANRNQEDEILARYFEDRGGLMFAEFNVAHGVKGRKRALDGIRFPDPPGDQTGAYLWRPGDHEQTVRALLRRHPVELIEVHKWGFYGFGQVVGKAALLEDHWQVHEARKVFLPDLSKGPTPGERADPATEQVFEAFGIDVVEV